MSTPPNTDWVGRLRYALLQRREPPSSIYRWLIAAAIFYFALRLSLRAFDERPGYVLEDLGLAAFDLAIICYGAGFLLYDSRRTLAGILWLADLLVFLPSGTVLLAAHGYLVGTPLGLLLALILPALLLVGTGYILWRYRSSGDGDARRMM